MKRCACLTRCAASSADSPGFSRARASGAAAISTFRTRVGESRGPKAEPEELMRIDLRARVRTKDGHDAGKVRRVIVDPATERITGFVVSTGGLLGREVIVGEDAFESTDAGGKTITLSLAKEDLESQPTFEEGDYMAPEPGWAAPTGYEFPPSAYLWPIDPLPVAEERDRPTIKKGDSVKDRDGDVVGSVEEIRFDEATGELLGFTVKAGAALERIFGGGKVEEISRDDILRITEGEVRLRVDREEIVPKERETGRR